MRNFTRFKILFFGVCFSSLFLSVTAQNFWSYSSAVWMENNGSGTFYNTYSSSTTTNGYTYSAQQHAINQGGGNWQSILFQGADFGAHITHSATLLYRGNEVKTLKINTSNVCGSTVHYLIYPTGNRPATPTFSSSAVSFFVDCNTGAGKYPDIPGAGPCNTGGYQKWQSGASAGTGHLTTNLVEDLTQRNEGQYTIELYYSIDGSNSSTSACNDIAYDNNSGNNYKATFTICPKFISSNYTSPAICGGNGEIIITIDGVDPSNYGKFYYGPEADGTYFSDVTVVANTTNTGIVATIHAPAGTYSNIRYWKTNNCSPVGNFDVTITDPSVQAGSNSITANQTICSGEVPAQLSGSVPVILPAGSPATFTYQWQSKTGTNSFSDISGATAQNYTPSALTTTTTYRRLVKITGCSDFISNEITVTVNPIPIITGIVSNCTGETLNSVTVNASLSSGTMEYSSDGGANWQLSNTFTGLVIGNTYNFVVRTVGTNCSSTMQQYVPSCSCPSVTNNTIAANQTICSGEIPVGLTGIVPTINPAISFTYQWQSKTGSNSFADISGATDKDFSPASGLATTTIYRRLIKISGCSDFYSNEITVTVNPRPTLVIEKSSPICFGTNEGWIKITVSGGSGSYDFSKDNGVTYITATSPYTFSGLVKGDYDILVKDHTTGCFAVCP